MRSATLTALTVFTAVAAAATAVIVTQHGSRPPTPATAAAGVTQTVAAGDSTRSVSSAAPHASAEPAGRTGRKSAAASWRPRPATYDVVVERDVPITLRDGVRLYADVYRPARDGAPAKGRFPVLLTQTPYNKTVIGQAGTRSDYLITRGYVQVIADVRGTGSSRGTWSPFGAAEQRDGVELVEWAASRKRAWSNGKVGTIGPSYMAINQLHTAALRPRALKAAFTLVPGADLYRDIAMSGGQEDVSFMPAWLALVTGAGLVPPAYTATDPGDGTLQGLLALLEHGGNAASFSLPTAIEMATGGEKAYDGPWWRSRSPINSVDKVKVPTFIVGGWYDLFQRGEPMLFDRLQRNGVPTKLLMGPWNHLQGAGLALTDPGTPAPNFDDYQLRWFDHYLRGIPDPSLDRDIPPITYYELGKDQGADPARWSTARRWMAPDVHARAYHLSGPARPGAPGRLAGGTGKGDPDTIVPVPLTGLCTRSASQWTAGNPLIDATCGADQRIDSNLGTAYDLPAAPRDRRLLGPVNARLFVSTTADDGAITARLESVAPDGAVKQLTAGWQVLSLRKLDRSRSVIRDGHVLQPWHPFTKDSERPAAGVMEVHVELFPTGAVVPAGHKLRLNLQTFDTPHTLSPLPTTLRSVGAISVHHDARHRSQLILPVRER